MTSNPNEYVLFTAPNTCARVPTIALEEIGLPFQTRLIRFMRNEHTSESFRAINPKGRVPALLCNGQALTENIAILRFLARRHPGAKLLPPVSSDLDDARQIADLCYCSATLHPIVTRIRIPTFFAEDATAQADVWRRAVAAMAVQFTLVERRLSEGEWWYGSDWSILDAYLNWCWFRVTGAGFDPTPFPCFAAHAERVAERPSVQRALRREQADEDTLRAEGLLFVPPPPPNSSDREWNDVPAHCVNRAQIMARPEPDRRNLQDRPGPPSQIEVTPTQEQHREQDTFQNTIRIQAIVQP